MKSRVLPFVALLAAVAACVFYFLSSSTPRDVAGGAGDSQPAGSAPDNMQLARGAERNSAAGISSGADGKKSRLDWKRLAEAATGDVANVLPNITAEDIARFLAKHGETPANLVTAFEKTNDRRLLDRALELFPNSPVILMAAVNSIPSGAPPKPGETYVPDPQRMAFIERFKAADPNNPLPWIFSAQELFKAKQTSEAVGEIRAALERPAFYTYANERMDSAQRLYEDLGLHPVEAAFVSAAGLALPHMSAAMQSSRSLGEWLKSASDSGDTAAVEDAIRLNYNLGRTFATPEASRTLVGQLVGSAMERRALEALPADAQRDWLAVTPAQRIAEMEAQKQAVKELVAASEWLYKSQDEQLWAEYLRRNRSDGEFSALTWLKTQRK